MTNQINNNSITIDQREFWLESDRNLNDSNTCLVKIKMKPDTTKVYPAISSEQYYKMIMARSERRPEAELSHIKEIKPAMKQASLLIDIAIQNCPEPIWGALEQPEKIGLGRSACRHALALCKIEDSEEINELYVYCGIAMRNRQLNKNTETTASINKSNGGVCAIPVNAPSFPALSRSNSSKKRKSPNNPNKIPNTEGQFAKRRFMGQITRLRKGEF